MAPKSMARFFSIFAVAAISASAVALPTDSVKDITRRESEGPVSGAPTVSATNTSCIDAAPYESDPFPINYANIQPAHNWVNYKVNDSWYASHYVSGPHVSIAVI